MSTVLDRFIRYVKYDTQSDERSATTPSTPGQLLFQRDLVAELRGIGLSDASLDDHGYVMATVPATTMKASVPAVGFIAHIDTSPEMSGAHVKPIVHERYDGRDVALPDDPTAILRLTDTPALAAQIGHDVVTASGTTLLGADDKAGVAEIVTAAEYLMAHPELAHGTIRLAFTPDEEIGRGANHFDVNRFGCRCAYTLDGGSRGEVESESFSADAMTLVFHGFNTHPGYAKGRMINAIKVAADFISRLPPDLSPETTEGYGGFVHPYVQQSGVDRTSVKLIVRDFQTEGLAEKEALIERLARETEARYPGSRVELAIEEQYRNMRTVLDRHPEVIAYAHEAVRRCGLDVVTKPIRGGTDGSRLSFMGLPTPNLFAGEHNFHSRLEWVSRQDMEKAIEVIVALCRVWEERTPL
ncbi:MAG TPA: peptidase T [Vicinamibacterales bacterium]|nr:peptidase T [Vicinamibacterales bacterium]